MKRGKILLIILASLLAVSLVYAVDSGTSAVDSNNAGADTLKQTAAETGGNLKNIGANLTGSLNDRTEDLLDREVVLPSWLELPARILLSIKGENKMTLREIIIRIAILIIFFIFLLEILGFSSFQETTSLIIAIGFTLIFAVTGVMNYLFGWVVNLSNYLGNWGVLILGAAVIILLILLKFFAKIRNKGKKIEDAQALGIRTSAGMKNVRDTSDAINSNLE